MFRAIQWALSGDVPKEAFAAVSDEDDGESQFQQYQQQAASRANGGGDDWHEGMSA